MYESFSPKSRTTNDITYEWGGYKTFEKEMNDSTPNAKGTISTAKLRLTVGYMNELSGTKIQGVTLEISYKWLSLPAFLNEDAITVNWDSNIFNSDGFYSDMGGEFIKGRYESFKFTTSPNKLASGGIGWTVPIVSGYHPGEKPVSIYGGGSIHLYPTSSIYTTSGRACQFILEYTHFYLSLTGGLNFSITGPSVSVSPSSGSDNLFSQYKWQSNVSYGAN